MLSQQNMPMLNVLTGITYQQYDFTSTVSTIPRKLQQRLVCMPPHLAGFAHGHTPFMAADKPLTSSVDRWMRLKRDLPAVPGWKVASSSRSQVAKEKPLPPAEHNRLYFRALALPANADAR